MNEGQTTCLNAFLKLFDGTAFDKPSFYEGASGTSIGVVGVIKSRNKAVKQKEIDEENEEIYMAFSHNTGYPQEKEDYQYYAFLQFSNLNKKFVSSLFGQVNYNYEIVKKVINDCYRMGKQHALFESLETIKDPAIHHYFKKAYQFKGISRKLISTETKISEVNFSDFFKTKNNTRNGKLRSRRITINYKFVISNGVIHPLADITFPISISDKIFITVDIHPDGKAFNEQQIEKVMFKLDIVLKERVDMILRKELKLKNKYLSTLTFEDKLNYLKVAEMSMI